jgi:hypothetical protein
LFCSDMGVTVISQHVSAKARGSTPQNGFQRSRRNEGENVTYIRQFAMSNLPYASRPDRLPRSAAMPSRRQSVRQSLSGL